MKDKQSWAIGGCTMIGVGIGFFAFPNVFVFVGSVILGVGIGLLAAAFIK